MTNLLTSSEPLFIAEEREQVAAIQNELKYRWSFWARPNQLPPEGEWTSWVIQAGRGWGKCLQVDTPIPTPKGWSTIGELKVGDHVFDELGQPTRVTYTSPVMLGN